MAWLVLLPVAFLFVWLLIEASECAEDAKKGRER